MKRMTSSLIVVFVVICAVLATAQESRAPKYDLDTSWPKLPLRNRWVLGAIGGICVDNQDHVFVMNRGTTDDTELDAGLNAPPVIEFDLEGNIVNGWGDRAFLGATLHDWHVDKENNIWVIAARGPGGVKKFTHDGKFLLQIGPSDKVDSSDGTVKGTPLNSNAAVFNMPAGVAVDPQNGDVYISDGEAVGGNHRVVVTDRTGKFLRQIPLNRTPGETHIAQALHCIGFSNDGLVYVCDRRAFRVQVFDRMGNFKKTSMFPGSSTRHLTAGNRRACTAQRRHLIFPAMRINGSSSPPMKTTRRSKFSIAIAASTSGVLATAPDTFRVSSRTSMASLWTQKATSTRQRWAWA